jgi:hypothetical protein
MLTLLVINEVLTNYLMNIPIIRRHLNHTIITTSIGILAGLLLLWDGKKLVL